MTKIWSEMFSHYQKYKLIIHCGACMLNRKETMSRIYKAKFQNVPITNYGFAIAYLKGGLERAVKIFSVNAKGKVHL